MKTNYELHTRLKGMDSNVMTNGFSPLHARILRMFDKFETKFHNCWFDNLYLSVKFARAAYVHKQKIRILGPTQKVAVVFQVVSYRRRKRHQMKYML